jgi:hypothetical protein
MAACNEALVAGALVLSAGCLYVGTPGHEVGTTTLHSAQLSSVTPPLATFVIRVAENDLSLDASQATAVGALSREMDTLTRPIDDARIILAELLVRAVNERRLNPALAAAAADRLVKATESAAPKMTAAVERLHRLLSPAQRKLLSERVLSRTAGWGRSWDANPAQDHAWTATLADGALAPAAEIHHDAVATARRWADHVVGVVRTKLDGAALDDAARSQLVTRLRTGERLD